MIGIVDYNAGNIKSVERALTALGISYVISKNPEDLNSGYCTKDKKHWVCEDCFNDFKEMFNFKLMVDKSVEEYKF